MLPVVSQCKRYSVIRVAEAISSAADWCGATLLLVISHHVAAGTDITLCDLERNLRGPRGPFAGSMIIAQLCDSSSNEQGESDHRAVSLRGGTGLQYAKD